MKLIRLAMYIISVISAIYGIYTVTIGYVLSRIWQCVKCGIKRTCAGMVGFLTCYVKPSKALALILASVTGACIAMVAMRYVFVANAVGWSMFPTVYNWDYLVCLRREFSRPITAGDIVVFYCFERRSVLLKRVKTLRIQYQPDTGKRIVEFWLGGDNKLWSIPSETIGWIREEDIIGRVIWIIPLFHVSSLAPPYYVGFGLILIYLLCIPHSVLGKRGYAFYAIFGAFMLGYGLIGALFMGTAAQYARGWLSRIHETARDIAYNATHKTCKCANKHKCHA